MQLLHAARLLSRVGASSSPCTYVLQGSIQLPSPANNSSSKLTLAPCFKCLRIQMLMLVDDMSCAMLTTVQQAVKKVHHDDFNGCLTLGHAIIGNDEVDDIMIWYY